MKTIQFLSVAFALLFGTLTSFAQNKEWKELQDFHSVMSKSFHPTEEGKFQPLKDNAAELLSKAKIWQASIVPEGYKVKETKEVLVRLVGKCDEIDKAVKAKKTDAELNTLIVQAHDIFHEIVEKCRDPKK